MKLALLQILYIFVVPIVLIYTGILPVDFRVLLLFFVTLLTVGIMRHEKMTHEESGLIKPWWKYWEWYLLVLVVGLAFTVYLSNFIPERKIIPIWKNVRLLTLFIPISILQEVLYRSFLMHKLKSLFNNMWTVILANTFLFTLLHIIYPHKEIMLPFAFSGGIVFAYIYYKKPNIVLISILHAILNFTAVYLGFFVIPS